MPNRVGQLGALQGGIPQNPLQMVPQSPQFNTTNQMSPFNPQFSQNLQNAMPKLPNFNPQPFQKGQQMQAWKASFPKTDMPSMPSLTAGDNGS